MAAKVAGITGSSGNPWQRFVNDYMKEEELDNALMGLLLGGYRAVSVQRWREGRTPPREAALMRERLEKRRDLVRQIRDLLRMIMAG